MAGLEDIINMLPIDEIASKFGVDRSTAQQAIQEGGATILSGLQYNAQTPEGASAIEQALNKHAGNVGDGTIDINSIDVDDGGSILGKIFGQEKQDVVQALNQEQRTASIDFAKLLPMLAPVVMGILANKMKPNQQVEQAQQQQPQADGGMLGTILGGLLGGGNTQQQPQAGGGMLGSILGGLFGR